MKLSCKVLACFPAMFLASVAAVAALVLTPVEYGHQVPAGDVAEGRYYNDQWHVDEYPWLTLNSDAGQFGPGYLLFDLSSVTLPTTGAHLSLNVRSRSDALYDWPYPVALYDVSDIAALYPPPGWETTMSLHEYMTSFWAVKADLTTGEVYGDFTVALDEINATLNIILEDPAIAAINASLGGWFAIGLGPGDPTNGNYFPSEAAGVSFEQAELTLKPVPEPCTMLLLGIGLAAFGGFHRKWKYKTEN